jgi:hypothetical protein
MFWHTAIKVTAICAVMAASSGSASAQDQHWAEKMFDKSRIEFGTVARGADTRGKLIVTNKYLEDVHIQSVTTSCGCAKANKPAKDLVKSLDSTEIEVVMDTVQHMNQKESNVIVTFDLPFYAQVRIPVRAFIRTDVVLQPGGVEFGSVAKGTPVERTVRISYAGRDTWTIRDVEGRNPNILHRLTEVSRGGGRVLYDLTVALKPETPIGDLREQIVLNTDDSGNPKIPVLVQGRVEPEYVVNPDIVSFGLVQAGSKKPMNVVVRGRKPFQIQGIQSEHTSHFEVRLPQDAKTIHVLPLTFTAPAEGGTIEDTFTITITGTGETVQFKAYAKVNGPAGAAAAIPGKAAF